MLLPFVGSESFARAIDFVAYIVNIRAKQRGRKITFMHKSRVKIHRWIVRQLLIALFRTVVVNFFMVRRLANDSKVGTSDFAKPNARKLNNFSEARSNPEEESKRQSIENANLDFHHAPNWPDTASHVYRKRSTQQYNKVMM